MSRNHKPAITLPPSRILHYVSAILALVTRNAERLRERAEEDGATNVYSARYAESFLEEFKLCTPGRTRHPGKDPIYAEPGYSAPESGCVAIANWNSVTEYRNGVHSTLSDLPERVGSALERIGVDLLWCDEWKECDGCGRLIRTNADSYSWKRASVYWEGETNCVDCVSEYAETFLGSLECGTRSNERGPNEAGCLPFPERIDPSAFGYVKQNEEEYENGFHPGQDDNPKQITNALLERGLSRFFFTLDESSQFYVTFSVWVHSEDLAEETERNAEMEEARE